MLLVTSSDLLESDIVELERLSESTGYVKLLKMKKV